MKNSSSNLINYINHLMHDDDALNIFLVDPITDSQEKWKITKAERAVLRRSIQNLSNNSVNGYSMQRDLSSYRRSLRLLQNVLHNVSSKMMHDAIKNESEENSNLFHFSVIVHYPIVSQDTDFTCRKNADVDKYGGPYARHTRIHRVSLSKKNPTIREVMDHFNNRYSFFIKYSHAGGYVSGFTIKHNNITADLSNSCYNLNINPDADNVFWFYKINGTPPQGDKSFDKHTLKDGDFVSWELIAPDAKYGFRPCAAHKNNKYRNKAI
jgi:hypothetical protein